MPVGRFFITLCGFLLFPALLGAQQPSGPHQPSQPARPEWSFQAVADALTGAASPTYTLQGTFFRGSPTGTTTPNPELVVHCAGGHFFSAYLATGVVVAVATNGDGGIARSLKGIAQGKVDYRFSGQSKIRTAWWEKSTDGTALFFDHFDLADLLVGKGTGSFSQPHPGDPKQLVKQIVFRVFDALGNPVEMVFEMPADEADLTRACGLENGKWRKRIR